MKGSGRFVAGATCPTCGALDRLKVDAGDARHYWCVACGFEARLNDEPADRADDTFRVRLPDDASGPAAD